MKNVVGVNVCADNRATPGNPKYSEGELTGNDTAHSEVGDTGALRRNVNMNTLAHGMSARVAL